MRQRTPRNQCMFFLDVLKRLLFWQRVRGINSQDIQMNTPTAPMRTAEKSQLNSGHFILNMLNETSKTFSFLSRHGQQVSIDVWTSRPHMQPLWTIGESWSSFCLTLIVTELPSTETAGVWNDVQKELQLLCTQNLAQTLSCGFPSHFLTHALVQLSFSAWSRGQILRHLGSRDITTREPLWKEIGVSMETAVRSKQSEPCERTGTQMLLEK